MAALPVAPQPQGSTYAPNFRATTEYGVNPRGYFSDSGSERATWAVTSDDSMHAATVLTSEEDPELLEVRVEKAGGRDAWRLKVLQENLPLRQGVNYRLSFRARARSPRSMGLGLWGNGVPGEPNVGLDGRTIGLDTLWRGFSESFAPPGATRPSLSTLSLVRAPLT